MEGETIASAVVGNFLKTQISESPCAPGSAVKLVPRTSPVERLPDPSSLTTSQCTVHLTPHEWLSAALTVAVYPAALQAGECARLELAL